MKRPTFFEKLMQIAEHEGFKNITDFAKNGLGYKSSQKLLRLKEEKNKPSIEILQDISNKFEWLNVDWLINDRGEMLPSAVTSAVYRTKSDKDLEIQQVPLYPMEASAGMVKLFQDNFPTKDFIVIPNLPKCDGALYVSGDSMYPLLKSGDIVAYKLINDPKTCIFMWGEMYLVSFEVDGDDYQTVKYIQKSEVGSQFIKLVSQNQNHQPMDIPRTAIKALALVKASVRITGMN